jgi:ADP-ribosylglycohydrolase
MASLPFQSLFCERFGCPPEDYEERAFRKLLYWHARLFAPVVRTIKPDFFADDFEFIRYLGNAVDVRQAKVDVLDFRDLDRKHWRLLHTGLRIRVSHRKARRLAFQLLGKPDWTDASGLVNSTHNTD